MNGAPAFTSSVLSALETALDVDLSAVGPFSVDEVVTVAVTIAPRVGFTYVGICATPSDLTTLQLTGSVS